MEVHEGHFCLSVLSLLVLGGCCLRPLAPGSQPLEWNTKTNTLNSQLTWTHSVLAPQLSLSADHDSFGPYHRNSHGQLTVTLLVPITVTIMVS